MHGQAEEWRREGRSVGCVPTMGYLHEGHLSLIRQARRETDRVAMSLFVNPTQFGPTEDYTTYPRDIEADCAKAEKAGVDAVFLPPVEEMYPPGYSTCVEVTGLSDLWEGTSRPGHFRGVATVVTKLFQIMKPHRAYFGQKDYQQALVIHRMAEDLDMDLTVVVMPTVREADGLAMSSRNAYLSPEEREAAQILPRTLRRAGELIQAGERDARALHDALVAFIRSEPRATVDYVAVCHPETLTPLTHLTDQALIALAVRIGKTRLIDNNLLTVGAPPVDSHNRPVPPAIP